MKPTPFCLALATVAFALPCTAQTIADSSVTPYRHHLSPAEITKILSSTHTGSGNSPLTSQEQARQQGGVARCDELDQAGSQALQNKNFTTAEADYQESIQLNPRSPNSYYGLGEALAGQGKTTEALSVYKTAVYWPLNAGPEGAAFSRSIGNLSNLRGCCGPTDAVAWMKYALLLSQTGQNAEAFSVYSRAIVWVNNPNRTGIALFSSAGPSSPTEFQAAAHIALGLLVNDTGNDRELAMSEFDQALRLTPDSAAANYNYGYGWKRLDLQSKTRLADAPQAKAALQKAAQADDENVKKAAGEALNGLR